MPSPPTAPGRPSSGLGPRRAGVVASLTPPLSRNGGEPGPGAHLGSIRRQDRAVGVMAVMGALRGPVIALVLAFALAGAAMTVARRSLRTSPTCCSRRRTSRRSYPPRSRSCPSCPRARSTTPARRSGTRCSTTGGRSWAATCATPRRTGPSTRSSSTTPTATLLRSGAVPQPGRRCNAKEHANLVGSTLGEDTFAYRSITPDNRVDTVRAYALVGEHRIVQVTVLGLDEHSAPDRSRAC